jgi:hypothetical protein
MALEPLSVDGIEDRLASAALVDVDGGELVAAVL